MSARGKWTCHLTFDAGGVRRMTIGRPHLRAGEYAIALKLKVPANIFVRSLPEVRITVPEAAVIEPEVQVLGELNPVPEVQR